MQKRGQSAMEYLMTYGWAILVVLIVLAALFYLGVFNKKSDVKTGVEGPFNYELKLGNDGIQVSLKVPSIIKSVIVDSISVNGQQCNPDVTNINSNTAALITCTGNINLNEGDSANVDISLRYTSQNSQIEHGLNINKKSVSEGTTLIVNGECGPANGQSFISLPATGLCNSGTISSITGYGPWTWTCNGIYGGDNAECSASAPSFFSSLAAYYKFDTLDSNVAVDETGRNNGTSYNGVFLNPSGRINAGAGFDGVNDVVEIPASMLDFGYDAFTISFWLNANTYPFDYGFVTTSAYSDSIDFRMRGSEFVLSVKNNIGNLFQTFNNVANALGSAPSVNTWYFITGTMNSNNICIYINSILEDCIAFSGTRFDSNQNLKIGRGGTSTSYYFNGLIDEVMVFNTALSQEKITELQNYFA